MTANLKLFNSLTRQLETFKPINVTVACGSEKLAEARVYTCGPTVYNYPHIGNMRAYIFADILGRTLTWKGYKLNHIINITDVGHLTDDADSGEDKMEKMADRTSSSIWEIAQHYTEAFWNDVEALNIRQPTKWSIATDYIDEMIEFATSIEKKHCYQLESGLYFDVSTVEDYGRLARTVTDDGESRIGDVQGKRNAADFALWRKTPAGEKRQMEWDSPWGKGAPGWHLECSVMSEKLLGFPFDIHTGGIDHREIHHPNEIAQNQAFCGCGGLSETINSGASIWMHNNFLVDRSGKMSKSEGEFLRLQLLVDKGYHPISYRLMCLQAHYRSELEFSWQGLQAALTRLKRIVQRVIKLENEAAKSKVHQVDEGCLAVEKLREEFDIAISDDLNTPVALTILEDVLDLVKEPASARVSAIKDMAHVLGLPIFESLKVFGAFRIRPKEAEITEDEIDKALALRAAARAKKDFAVSDAVRDQLAKQGVEVMDGDPLGWEWKLA